MVNIAGRTCAWCTGPIPHTARRDTVTCSKPCRQLEFSVVGVGGGDLRAGARAVGGCVASRSRRPVALGRAGPRRGQMRPTCRVGLERKRRGWPSSTRRTTTSSPRRGPATGSYLVDATAWARPHTTRPPRWCTTGSAPAFHDGSREVPHDGSAADLRDGSAASTRDGFPLTETESVVRTDSLVYGSRPRLTDPARVTGAKPARFCKWLFELLGAADGDELVDLFPGSGGVERAWRIYAAALREDPGGTLR
jgi:hypothetical protein